MNENPIAMFVRILPAITLLMAAGAWADPDAQAVAPEQRTFDGAARGVQQKLEESVAELAKLREQAAAEKVPLARKLSGLEAELIQVRGDYQQASRMLDSRTLDLSNLRSEIKSRQQEATYLSNLLGEYVRNFESRLHIAEIQRYRDVLEAAKLAPENRSLSQEQVYQAQANLVVASLGRLQESLGGTQFDGTAVDDVGLVKPGTFVLVGPVALFRSEDGRSVGTVEQRLGSLEPAIASFGAVEDAQAAAKLARTSAGQFPLDPSLGDAHKIESTEQTLWEHVRKGGPVMVPILVMAVAVLVVASYRWIGLALLRNPSQKQVKALLDTVAKRDPRHSVEKAKTLPGPVGKMLVAGVEHLNEPPELIEEVMYEIVLATRLRLQRLLPFVAICAGVAPLLGLLGTVTGIINTFKLITVFGSGDVKTLSGGISEALITTEFGLIVAIPSLLVYAFLSRKARRVVNHMEKAGIALVNEVIRSRHKGVGDANRE